MNPSDFRFFAEDEDDDWPEGTEEEATNIILEAMLEDDDEDISISLNGLDWV